MQTVKPAAENFAFKPLLTLRWVGGDSVLNHGMHSILDWVYLLEKLRK